MKKLFYLFFLFLIVFSGVVVASERKFYMNFTSDWTKANCGVYSPACMLNKSSTHTWGWKNTSWLNNSNITADYVYFAVNYGNTRWISNDSTRGNYLRGELIDSDYVGYSTIALFPEFWVYPNDTISYWCKAPYNSNIHFSTIVNFINGTSPLNFSWHPFAEYNRYALCGNGTWQQFTYNLSYFLITTGKNAMGIEFGLLGYLNVSIDDIEINGESAPLPENQLPQYERVDSTTGVNDLWASVDLTIVANDTEDDKIYYELFCNGYDLEENFYDITVINFDWDTPQFWDTYIADFRNVSHWNKTNNVNTTNQVQSYNASNLLISMDIKENNNKGGIYFKFYNNLDNHIQSVLFYYNATNNINTYFLNSSGLLEFYANKNVLTTNGIPNDFSNIKIRLDNDNRNLNLFVDSENLSNESISYLVSDDIDYYSFTAVNNFTNNISELRLGSNSGYFEMFNYKIAYDTPKWTEMTASLEDNRVMYEGDNVCYYFENGDYQIDIFIIDEGRNGRGVSYSLDVEIYEPELVIEENLQNASESGNIFGVLKETLGKSWIDYNDALGLTALAQKMTLVLYLIMFIWLSISTRSIKNGLILSSLLFMFFGIILSYFTVTIISIIGLGFGIAYHFGIGEEAN